jgi:hypothetical protein
VEPTRYPARRRSRRAALAARTDPGSLSCLACIRESPAPRPFSQCIPSNRHAWSVKADPPLWRAFPALRSARLVNEALDSVRRSSRPSGANSHEPPTSQARRSAIRSRYRAFDDDRVWSRLRAGSCRRNSRSTPSRAFGQPDTAREVAGVAASSRRRRASPRRAAPFSLSTFSGILAMRWPRQARRGGEGPHL